MARGRKPSRYLPAVVLGVLVVGGSGLAVWGLSSFLSQPPLSMKPTVQEIRIIRPPPPPPQREEPPPPEEEVDVQDDIPPEPTQMADAPPGDVLGIDAEGAAGGDGFGLVARPGGRDLLASGGGSAFAWYAGVMRGELQAQLQQDAAARRGAYAVSVRVWIGLDGTIQRVSLVQSTGDAARDRAIEDALTRLGRISRPPPPGLPQPVSLRVVSRA